MNSIVKWRKQNVNDNHVNDYNIHWVCLMNNWYKHLRCDQMIWEQSDMNRKCHILNLGPRWGLSSGCDTNLISDMFNITHIYNVVGLQELDYEISPYIQCVWHLIMLFEDHLSHLIRSNIYHSKEINTYDDVIKGY